MNKCKITFYVNTCIWKQCKKLLWNVSIEYIPLKKIVLCFIYFHPHQVKPYTLTSLTISTTVELARGKRLLNIQHLPQINYFFYYATIITTNHKKTASDWGFSDSTNFLSNWLIVSTFTQNRAPPDTNSNHRPMTAAQWLVPRAASSAVSLARRLLGKLPTQTNENTSSLSECMLWIFWCGYDVTVLSPCCHGQIK